MRIHRHWARGLAAGLLAAAAASGTALAEDDTCREWRDEHREWKARALQRFLRGAPEREVESALFEALQREAYLTSCEVSAHEGRHEFVGWRLQGRVVDDYGSAVAESVLAQAGFDLSLGALFADAAGRE
jgi:hypothetical protein